MLLLKPLNMKLRMNTNVSTPQMVSERFDLPMKLKLVFCGILRDTAVEKVSFCHLSRFI